MVFFGWGGNVELLRSDLVEVWWYDIVKPLLWWSIIVELLSSGLVKVWGYDDVKPCWSIIVELLRSGLVEVWGKEERICQEGAMSPLAARSGREQPAYT